MSQPAEITEAWQALAEAEAREPSDKLRALAAQLEELGLKVSVIDGALYADDVNVDPQTGIADCVASFRVEQEN